MLAVTFGVALAAGLGWALAAAFAGTVTGRRPREEPLQTPALLARSTIAAFLTGLGLSGASVHAFGHVAPAHEVGLAIASGALVAVFVRAAVALAAASERGG
jgi:hypothetical protein